MKRLFILPLVALLALPAHSQSLVKRYVQDNTTPIASIQPNATDYTDLEQIGTAIGDARIVMLGEQAHGDGATFLAKTRLVKYLHEQKGFEVLAFEGDFFGLNAGWDELPKEKAHISKFLQDNIYTIWAKSEECSELLYEYIPGTYKTSSPLQITGFDNQVYLDHSPRYLRTYVDSFLRKSNIPFVQSKAYQDEFLPAVEGLTKGWLVNKTAELQRLEDQASVVVSQLEAQRGGYEWLLLKNIQSFAAANHQLKNTRKAIEIRDKQMAENLTWLLQEKFPDKKVIVWAANAHISKNANTAFKHKKLRMDWMGTVFAGDSLYNASTYVLGFASQHGMQQTTMEPSPSKVYPPSKKGFENWIDRSHSYAFVNFKPFREQHPTHSDYFAMKGHGHYNKLADWTSVFDGVFFIREMTPSKRIN